MNPNNLKAPKPTLVVLCSDRLKDPSVLDTVLYGAEEEGIPFEVNRVPEDNVLNLAHEASKQSVLSTGIGISESYAAVHYSKLPLDKPVYLTANNAGEEALRRVGANGARLVKRVPLKIIADT